MVAQMKPLISDWKFDAVSMGFPVAGARRPDSERTENISAKAGSDSISRKHSAKPVRIINDAALQALGSYRGGRMLFLGLGTGLGSALGLEQHRPSRSNWAILPTGIEQSLKTFLGRSDRTLGDKEWQREVELRSRS